jgi:hypothetical protein
MVLGCRIVMAASLALVASGAQARIHRCRPTIKYECAAQRCVRVTEGFQHAESFAWDDRTGRLTACLWSRCYQGSPKPLRDPSGTVTLAGPLSAEPPGQPPIFVSVTIGADGKFTAVWEQRSDGLVFDVGTCDVPALRDERAAAPGATKR